MQQKELEFRVWTGLEMEYKVMVGFLGAFFVQGMDPKDSASMSPMNTKYLSHVSIMQFTGILDKTGKKIFEGDIVTRMCFDPLCEADHTGVVEYSAHWGYYFLREKIIKIQRSIGEYYPPLAHGNPANGIIAAMEVIGNIYENK